MSIFHCKSHIDKYLCEVFFYVDNFFPYVNENDIFT